MVTGKEGYFNELFGSWKNGKKYPWFYINFLNYSP
jgi:hypothetical protein